MDRYLKSNQRSWDLVADQFDSPLTALPYWGPYKVGKKLNLLGRIKGKRFLEIGCGAGRSIEYLMKKGALKVTGTDISQKQIELSGNRNEKWIKDKKVTLLCSPMEEKLALDEEVDVVFSNYALGWTVNPGATLTHIYSYLKKTGIFVWSWEHPDFNRVEYAENKSIYKYSYFEKDIYLRENWRKSGNNVYLYPRTVSQWFGLLVENGFSVVNFVEPEPEEFNEEQKNKKSLNKYYYYKKARMVPSTMIFVCRKE